MPSMAKTVSNVNIGKGEQLQKMAETFLRPMKILRIMISISKNELLVKREQRYTQDSKNQEALIFVSNIVENEAL